MCLAEGFRLLVLTAIEDAGLLLQLKCSFASDTTAYVSHVISQKGISPEPAKSSRFRPQ